MTSRKSCPKKQKPRRAATLRGFAAIAGGDEGIRTLDPGFGPDAPLAGECLRPLGHVSQTVLVAAEAFRNETCIIAAKRGAVKYEAQKLPAFFVSRVCHR